LVEPPVVLCLRKFFPLPALLEGIERIVQRGTARLEGLHRRDLFRVPAD
jgi:hypothetical protein